MNKKTLLYVGIYAVVAYGGWYLYNNTKKAYVKKILSGGIVSGVSASDEAALLTYEKGFLKSWSIGLKDKSETFTYNGKNYYTKGGRGVR